VGPKWWFKGDPIVPGPIMMQQKQDRRIGRFHIIGHLKNRMGYNYGKHTMNVLLNIDEY
jgi:hypothetical protein